MGRIIAAIVALGLSLAPAVPAHADDDAYVAALSAAGVPMLGGPGQWISGGYTVCGQLRNGESPAVAATQFQMLNAWGPAIVDAAQHDLCPDTLHH